MAVPDTFKFMFVALLSMIAFRIVNELQGTDAPANKTSVDEGVIVSHSLETGKELVAPKGKTGEVIIEYCRS